MSSPTTATTAATDNSWSDDDEAKQKRFNILAGVGVLVVLALGYFVVAPGGDAEPMTIVSGGDSTAAPVAVAEAVPVASTAAPLPPGMSGGSGGGGGGGGGGRPTSGATPTKAAGSVVEAVRTSAMERFTSLGLRPRAAAALADSAARRAQPAAGRAPQAGSEATGGGRLARAVVLMASPGGGAVATVPAGASVSLSGCRPVGGTTWCQASYNGMTGYVRQSDVHV